MRGALGGLVLVIACVLWAKGLEKKQSKLQLPQGKDYVDRWYDEGMEQAIYFMVPGKSKTPDPWRKPVEQQPAVWNWK